MTLKLIVSIISALLSLGLTINLAAEEGKPEEKFDFTLDGEARGYIGLDQARIQAIEHARDNTDFYGPKYKGVNFVFEFKSAEETEDYYEINLSFRAAGRWRGETGLEQFIFDKTGDLRIRQLFDEPMPETMPEAQEERATEPQLETVTELDTEPQLETETEPITQSVETVPPPVAAPEYTIADDDTSIGARETGGSDLESLREELEAFEDRVARLSVVKKELDSLDTTEFSQQDHALSGMLKSPDMVEEAEARLAELKQAINLGGNN